MLKRLLNHLIKKKGSDSFFCKIRAQSAGVSVRATKPEKHTEATSVKANCLCITPVKPSINATGTKTAESTSTMEMTGATISPIAFVVASLTLRSGSSCKILSTFSITMMASSTTIPIARMSAKRVIKFIENPKA